MKNLFCLRNFFLAVAVVATACGGDDSTSSPSTSPTNASAGASGAPAAGGASGTGPSNGNAGTAPGAGGTLPNVPGGNPSKPSSFDTLASSLNQPYGIALDDGFVYTTLFGEKSVVKIPKSGGNSLPLATAKVLWGIAVGSNQVYFANDSGVFRVPTTGGMPSTLASTKNALAVALDGSSLYFGTYATSGMIFELSLSSASAMPQSRATAILPMQIALDDTSIYYSSAGQKTGEASLHKVPKHGGATDIALVSGAGQILGIAVDATHVYYADATGNAILRVPKTGGASANLAVASSPASVVVDGDWVYWVNYEQHGGAVMKIRTDGSGTAVVIANAQDSPFSLAVDKTHVYWATYTSQGQVRRALK